MKGTGSGLGRALRWIVLLLCAGGVALALDTSRTSPVGAGMSILDWLSAFSWDEKPAVEPAPGIAAPNASRPSLSTGEFYHRVLFSRPAAGWRLDPSNEQSSTLRAAAEISPVVVQRNADNAASTMFWSDFPRATARNFIATPDGGPPPPPAFWIANASGNWSTPTNWQGGVVPSGPAAEAHFDTLDITNDVTVTLDSSRLIGELYVGDTNGTHRYDIAPGSGGQTLTFANLGATAILHQSSTSAGDTISVPIRVDEDLAISNASTTNPFQISGNINSSLPNGQMRQVSFVGTVFVSGNITPGPNGGDLSLTISGDVNLSGTNTYGGTTFVTGKLFVKGDNSGADGLVQVAGGGSLLSGIGTVGGIVTIFGGTITGGTTDNVGTLTLTQSVSISASEGGGGTYLANLDGDISDLLSITGTLNIGSGTTLNIQGDADGTTTYTLATYLSHTGMFAFDNVPANYDLIYGDTALLLVPVPEPATWIGGGLALGALAFAWRRKKNAEKLKR